MRATIATLCILILVGFAVAMAATPKGAPRLQPWSEIPAFENQDGDYVAMDSGATAHARCWGEQVEMDQFGNAEEWNVEVRNEASIAQWVELGMNIDGFHWGVRQPGDYAAGCLDLWVRSNYDISITAEGFEDLQPIDSSETIDSIIEVKYAFTDDCNEPPDPDDSLWMTPDQVNQMDVTIEDSYDLHYVGWMKHIWASINVTNCNGPTDWVDPDWATITLNLDEQQPWIDPETGEFAEMPEFPFQ